MYPESAAYSNTELNISIDFPEVVYNYSNTYGRIKASELWYKDVWERNELLLTDMAAQYYTLIDSVDIAN